jgi:hypothetical protein
MTDAKANPLPESFGDLPDKLSILDTALGRYPANPASSSVGQFRSRRYNEPVHPLG